MKNRDFRISDKCRKTMSLFSPIFKTDENLLTMYKDAQSVAKMYNESYEEKLSSAKLHSSAVLHLVYQYVINKYSKESENDPFSRIAVLAKKNEDCAKVLDYYNNMFPTLMKDDSKDEEETIRAFFVQQVFQANPALMEATKELLNQKDMKFPGGVKALKTMLGSYLESTPFEQGTKEDLFTFLTMPARLFPDSLSKQIAYIIQHWDAYLPEEFKSYLLRSIDLLNEENKIHGAGAGEISIPSYANESDYEAFTEDKNWMPNVVMIAKSTLVWLDQLSKKYMSDIHTLDAIPDEELDYLQASGFTALWLIGLWERSPASKRIKNLCGNPDAESSAYSLKGYVISSRIGGWDALNNLKARCWARGIRLASDMVPNHTGLDSDWIYSHPDYFMQQDYPPFPSYTYNGEDLSNNPDVEIKIEDHYFDRTDAAVTFRKFDKKTGKVSYIFHGNDGTTMPWNDTAQLDFLNPQTREAVIQQILEVARAFPIIRFDAAMTLAKKHIQRLWYPKPGTGGDIAGRATHTISDADFNKAIPVEFWREVVDRIQQELPETLLLAEAFWMMESYFVRTLGMHRVYNSAFMHMLKNQDNAKYRQTIKSTIAFDPEILKRYVNFMNNPDEDTAIAQFGDSDKYFGVCTLLATMPGLPMFGHGQIEGYREKYGMEYQRAYWNEVPNENLIEQHRNRIFPLLKKRYLFSGCNNFNIYDVEKDNVVNEDVFAYTNGEKNNMTLVLYNNRYERSEGCIKMSAPKKNKVSGTMENISIGQALGLTMSGRRFTLYKNFSNSLWYIMPSMKIIEEGIWISLNGYESRVLTDVYEVEDVDGVYQKLYDKFQDQGFGNIENEIKQIYLEPFFTISESLTSSKFIKDSRTLLLGRGNSTTKHNMMQALGTYYTYLEEMTGLLEKLNLSITKVTPSSMLDSLTRIEDVCKLNLFKNGNTILEEEIGEIFSATCLLLPFAKSAIHIDEALDITEKLMIEKLFKISKETIQRCVLIASSQPKNIENLLKTNAFLKLIGCNEYQGIRWYRGESFQECMYIALLSKAISDQKDGFINEDDYNKELKFWLEKAEKAGYKVDNLI